jgi:hypothetical protein
MKIDQCSNDIDTLPKAVTMSLNELIRSHDDLGIDNQSELYSLRDYIEFRLRDRVSTSNRCLWELFNQLIHSYSSGVCVALTFDEA